MRRALVRAARPHQWTKNLLVFAGLLFSGRFQDAQYWPEAAGDLRRLLRGLQRLVPAERRARRRARPRPRPQAAAPRRRGRVVRPYGLSSRRPRRRRWPSGSPQPPAHQSSCSCPCSSRSRPPTAGVKHVPFADVARDRPPVRRAGGSRRGSPSASASPGGSSSARPARPLPRAGQAERRAHASGAAGRPVLARYGVRGSTARSAPAAAALAAYIAYAFSGPTAPPWR